MERRSACRCPLAKVCSRGGGPFREVRRHQHNILFVQGESASHVYFLQRGTVSLHRMGKENQALGRTRALRHAGSFLGLETLIDEDYQDSARAETDLRMCMATRERIQDWMGDPNSVSNLVLRTLLKTEDDELLTRASPDGTALQRVATWILDQHQIEKTTEVPRKVIAELLGMRPETLSRALHSLCDEGLIEVSRRRLYAVDPGGLRKKLRD